MSYYDCVHGSKGKYGYNKPITMKYQQKWTEMMKIIWANFWRVYLRLHRRGAEQNLMDSPWESDYKLMRDWSVSTAGLWKLCALVTLRSSHSSCWHCLLKCPFLPRHWMSDLRAGKTSTLFVILHRLWAWRWDQLQARVLAQVTQAKKWYRHHGFSSLNTPQLNHMPCWEEAQVSQVE